MSNEYTAAVRRNRLGRGESGGLSEFPRSKIRDTGRDDGGRARGLARIGKGEIDRRRGMGERRTVTPVYRGRDENSVATVPGVICEEIITVVYGHRYREGARAGPACSLFLFAPCIAFKAGNL